MTLPLIQTQAQIQTNSHELTFRDLLERERERGERVTTRENN